MEIRSVMADNNLLKNAADRRGERARYRFPLLMMTPFMIMIIIFVVIPVIVMIVMSFTDMDVKMAWHFIGFNNYRKIFGYPKFKQIIVRTLLFVLFDVFFSVLGSIFVCIITTYYLDIVYQRKNLGLFYRILWLIPNLTPQIVYMLIWKLCFGAEGYGLINNMLAALHLPTVDWFTKASFQLLVFVNCLKSASGSIILFSSAIQQIPQSIIQSARVDGAGNMRICMKIVLPYLKWPITQKTLWSILGNFTAYESIRLFTNGGPMGGTTTYAYYIYQNAYSYYRYGYGAALSVFLVCISILLGMVMLHIFKVDKQLHKSRMDI